MLSGSLQRLKVSVAVHVIPDTSVVSSQRGCLNGPGALVRAQHTSQRVCARVTRLGCLPGALLSPAAPLCCMELGTWDTALAPPCTLSKGEGSICVLSTWAPAQSRQALTSCASHLLPLCCGTRERAGPQTACPCTGKGVMWTHGVTSSLTRVP